MRDLISHMEGIYGLSPDRRTVYSAVELLQDLGYDISNYEENGRGYYFRGRELELSEVLLVTDAIYSCPVITGKQSNDLVKKLQGSLSTYKRKQYRHLTIARDGKKGSNKQVFLNIEILDEAITKKRKISFTYLEYDTTKKLVPRRAKPYVGSCYGMTYMNEHYYLICLMGSHTDLSLYRIDRMKDVEILDEKADMKEFDKAQIQSAIYAYLGAPETIEFRADKSILSDVIDKFGTEIFIIDEENSFTATFTAPPQGIKFWALQYLDHVEITKPAWLRQEIADIVKRAGGKYGE